MQIYPLKAQVADVLLEPHTHTYTYIYNVSTALKV